MAAASGAYAQGLRELDETAWESGNVKGMLVGTSFTLDKETHTHLDDISAQKYGGAGTDPALATPAVAVDTSNNEVDYSGAVTTFASVAYDTEDADGVVWYYDTGGADNTKWLICFDKFASPVTPNGNNINVTPATAGLLRKVYGA